MTIKNVNKYMTEILDGHVDTLILFHSFVHNARNIILNINTMNLHSVLK
jgi:hypothetical protein